MYYNLNGVELTFGMNVGCNGKLFEDRPSWLPRKSDQVKAFNAVKIRGRNPNVKINVEDEFERLHPFPRNEGEPLQFHTPYAMRVTATDFKNGKKMVFTAFIAKLTNGTLISQVKTWEEEIQPHQEAQATKTIELPKLEVVKTAAHESIDLDMIQKLAAAQIDGGQNKNGNTRRSRQPKHETREIFLEA